MATQKKWRLSGDYFENCNCNVVCPCLVSPSPPMTARPSQGVCDVALVFHIDKGSYDNVSLDGMAGKCELILSTKVRGETDTVSGPITFDAAT
jgi:hypothetical protein